MRTRNSYGSHRLGWAISRGGADSPRSNPPALLSRQSLLRGAFDYRRALFGDHDGRRVGVG